MASFTQHSRYTPRHQNIPQTWIDIARPPVMSSLRAAFIEGEVDEMVDGRESPVDPYMPTIVAETRTERGEEQIERKAGREERSEPCLKRDPETSWYDDSVSGDGEVNRSGEQTTELVEKEQVFKLEGDLGAMFELEGDIPAVFELEGDLPAAFELEGDSPHHRLIPRPAAFVPYGNTAFELEVSHPITSLPRRRSYSQCQHESRLGHDIQNIGRQYDSRPIVVPTHRVEDHKYDWSEPPNEDQISRDKFKGWRALLKRTAGQHQTTVHDGRLTERQTMRTSRMLRK